MRRVRSVRPIAAQSGVRSLRTMREIFQPDERYGATLAIYADERNPRLKCRKCNQAKLADTPDPNGKMPAWRSEGADQDYSTAHPVYRGQLRIANTSPIGTGELPHRSARAPGRETASARRGGRRRRSSQMPGCNGQDRVKVRLGKPNQTDANGCGRESR
jgi:hypothetical protein